MQTHPSNIQHESEVVRDNSDQLPEEAHQKAADKAYYQGSYNYYRFRSGQEITQLWSFHLYAIQFRVPRDSYHRPQKYAESRKNRKI